MFTVQMYDKFRIFSTALVCTNQLFGLDSSDTKLKSNFIFLKLSGMGHMCAFLALFLHF